MENNKSELCQQNKNMVWNIRDIFTYDHNYQEHCGDGVIYYDCELLIDFGPFKKGYKCNISIESQTHGDFTMWVGGKMFVPVWTYMND